MNQLPEQQSSLLADEPLSVSQLNREARYLLEENFPSVLVEGEISNIAMPASGHWYLTLKDDSAQVRCAMFRNRNQLIRFRPEDGMQVLVKAKLSLYESRGDYQLIVEQMEELGDGALRRAFDLLKEKLLQEGIFDEEHKKELPALAKHIGVITSPTGAAIRDIISVLKRRFPSILVTILPVSVQGQNSASEMIQVIKLANLKQGCLQDIDVLIIARGGGSLEDLWSFNDEQLARAIFASVLPIVSAVGHEVDFTIADFVADLRAATPSAAAELISPDQEEYQQLLYAFELQFAAIIQDKIKGQHQRLSWLKKRLKHPGRRIQEQAQRLDEMEARLKLGFKNLLYRGRAQLKQLSNILLAYSPLSIVTRLSQENQNLHRRLLKASRQFLQNKKQTLLAQSHALNTVNPLNTLARGYTITSTDNNEIITRYSQLKPGANLLTRLHQGQIFSTVNKVKK